VCVSACLSVCEPPVCDRCTDKRSTHSRQQTSTTGNEQTDGSPHMAPHSDSLRSQSANRPLLCLSVCLSVRFPPPPTHRRTHSRQQTAHTQTPHSTHREKADQHTTNPPSDRQTDRQTEREREFVDSSADHPASHTHTHADKTSSTQQRWGRGPSRHSTAASSPSARPSHQPLSQTATPAHRQTDRHLCVRDPFVCVGTPQSVSVVCCRSARRMARRLCLPPMGTAHRLNAPSPTASTVTATHSGRSVPLCVDEIRRGDVAASWSLSPRHAHTRRPCLSRQSARRRPSAPTASAFCVRGVVGRRALCHRQR